MAEIIFCVHILAVVSSGLRQLSIPANGLNRWHISTAAVAAFLPDVVYQLKQSVFIDGVSCCSSRNTVFGAGK